MRDPASPLPRDSARRAALRIAARRWWVVAGLLAALGALDAALTACGAERPFEHRPLLRGAEVLLALALACGWRRRRGHGASRPVPVVAVYTLLLALVSAPFLMFPEHTAASGLRVDWAFWVVACHWAGFAVIFGLLGKPASRAEWVATASMAPIVVGIAVARITGELSVLGLWALELALRAGIIGLWSFAVLGLPLALLLARIGRREGGWPSVASRRIAGCWFATVLLLALAEPMAAVVERGMIGAYRPVRLPEQLAEPAAGELRIAAVGGSTMVGVPYHPHFGMPQAVGWKLQQLFPERRVVVENLAREGYNLRRVLGELAGLRVRPHILLIYTGHNEFYHDLEELTLARESPFAALDEWLSLSPLFRVFDQHLAAERASRTFHSGARELIDRPIATPLEQERRLNRFRRGLEQIAEFARWHGIVAVFLVPAGNEAGYEPNRSVVLAGTSAGRRATIARLYETARRLEEQGQWTEAAERYREGLAAEPDFAEFHFRLAECLFALGRYEEARRHYQAALEADGHPNRATARYRRHVAEVAREYGHLLIDSPALLRAATEHGILDRTMFHDNVHLTIRGYLLLSEAIVAELDRSGALGRLDDASRRSPRLQARAWGQGEAEPEPAEGDATARSRTLEIQRRECLAALGVGREELAAAYESIGGLSERGGLRWLSRLRFDPSRRLREAQRYLDWADALRSGRIEPGEAGTESLE